VVGITGSNGKTSTKNMLREILSRVGETVAPRDSFNNEVGLPLTVLKLQSTTKYLVLELGAAGIGSIKALASWCLPDIGVELKVGLAHAGAFGGIEVTAQIKREMMPFIQRVAILNEDDPVVRGFEPNQGVKRVGFGFAREADFEIKSAELSLSGTKLAISYPDGQVSDLTLKMLGEHQAMNVSAALAVAQELGVQREIAIEAVSEMEMAERWRMQLMRRHDGVFVINDAYNASPDSMRAALQTLATLGRQGHRTIAVLGQMAELGEYSIQEHDQLGRLVVRYNIDQLFVVGQEAKLIHLGAMQEGSWDGESVFCETISAAFDAIHDKLSPGDIVLVKSSNIAGLRFLGDELAGVK
jgi:UDP-N-acetylmuramoyl-tripeptide--D-alanyl-D-alanine ligase